MIEKILRFFGLYKFKKPVIALTEHFNCGCYLAPVGDYSTDPFIEQDK